VIDVHPEERSGRTTASWSSPSIRWVSPGLSVFFTGLDDSHEMRLIRVSLTLSDLFRFREGEIAGAGRPGVDAAARFDPDPGPRPPSSGVRSV